MKGQEEKLQQIRNILQSYLKEKIIMEKVVESMTAFITQRMNDEMMMNVGCDVSFSQDEYNHVKLYRVI